MQSVNGAQFLNITPLFLSSNRLAALSAPAPVIVIVPFTSMYTSLESHKMTLTSKFEFYLTIGVIRST